jgi:GntR family transcriptional regulator, rspAB operon transcriptional repressor
MYGDEQADMVMNHCITENESAANRTSDRIVEQLRKMIITSEIAPGSNVSEAYLAKRLQCGRTPLREAIQRLSQEYLIVSEPRRGVTISDLSLLDFGRLIEALLVVEATSVGLATERMSDEWLARLESNITEIEQANNQGDLARVTELDSAFHNILAQATNNHYLTDTITGLHRAFSRFGYIAWQRNGSAGISLSEHRAILDAVTRGEPALARQLTRSHVLAARDRIVEAISGQTLTTMEEHDDKNVYR